MCVSECVRGTEPCGQRVDTGSEYIHHYRPADHLSFLRSHTHTHTHTHHHTATTTTHIHTHTLTHTHTHRHEHRHTHTHRHDHRQESFPTHYKMHRQNH